ncbi:hypothetical protein ZIOFF_031864 [Zingiber officinale]|uniref:Uncharacterized protein n=1 Tax=Zingiber officinale TaxID=94328 RepID=A0A8J5L5R9_ZINOF|nr:hypothetical protein ZIOFF_031864 [Zingiber officinale]
MNLSMEMWMTVIVGAVAVYWFVWVMGSAEVKGKRTMNLKMGSSMWDKVQEYWSFFLRSKEIVQYPLPGYVTPSSISFNPDGRLISYLFSPDGTLHRKVFAFDVASWRQELVICLPDGGGLDESNLSAEEKLRRERSRERGLGVTRYEWKSRSTSSSCSALGKPTIMVPLPNGLGCLIIKCSRSLEPVGILMYTTAPPQAVWGVSEQQHNKKVEATIKEISSKSL